MLLELCHITLPRTLQSDSIELSEIDCSKTGIASALGRMDQPIDNGCQTDDKYHKTGYKHHTRLGRKGGMKKKNHYQH